MRSGLVARCAAVAVLAAWTCLCAACAGPRAARAGEVAADVVVYGSTSAGVVAAVQLARDGHSVLLVDCDGWVGGMTTAGLGATDVGSDAAVGGIAREFYGRLRAHYDEPTAWPLEPRAAFRGRGHEAGSDVAWTFEPHVASAVFARMLEEVRVVPLAARLDRAAGAAAVRRDGGRLAAVRTEAGLWLAARVFLDCSYEGDLLAAAGCTFAVGREANAEFGETLDGVALGLATAHQFAVPVDPWRRPGVPASGLLPGIEAGAAEPDGSADGRVQAYCYRICASRAADRVPWPRPSGYDERDFELLLRWYDAGGTGEPWHPVPMPNLKTDSNNNGPVSTDGIGRAWSWATAGYAERARLAAAQRDWQQGLLWTLAHHPRVPLRVRRHFQAYGLARDEFAASAHWPPVLYVREARRLRGELVLTEAHCRGAVVEGDPIGLGAYGMDSHNVRRLVVAGAVRNEGDVQVRVPRPYGISYRALTPRRAECDNLLVPVCVSATHIAFGSIRMEPVFMVLGQSAAIAAGIACELDVAVQDVTYAVLRRRLVAAGQRLPADLPPPR